MSNFIHSTAIIDKNAHIGNKVSIGAYSIIKNNVFISDGNYIDCHVSIENDSYIGKNNYFYKGSSIGHKGQIKSSKLFSNTSLKDNKLIIGDNNTFREYVTVHKGEIGKTYIGNNNYFMTHSHIAHDCFIQNNVVLANYVALGGFVRVGNNSFISASTCVHQNIIIGDYVMVGGLSRISKNIIHFALVSGLKPRLYGVNVLGLKKSGFDDDFILDIKKAYKILFCQNFSLIESILILKKKIKNRYFLHSGENISYLLDFINDMKIYNGKGIVIR